MEKLPYPDVSLVRVPEPTAALERVKTGMPLADALDEYHRGLSDLQLKQQINGLTRTMRIINAPMPLTQQRIHSMRVRLAIREFGI